jgi:hypothetical protein
MSRELTYEAPERRRERLPDGTTRVNVAPTPGWLYGHWRRRYGQSRGKARKEVVGLFADSFGVDGAVAERILRDDTPHHTEPDGTFVMTIPD